MWGILGTVTSIFTRLKRIVFYGTCDSGMGASTTVIVCADLAGFGNDYFNNKFHMEVLLNANSVGNAPERTQRQITDYVSATGTFTVTAFGANAEENDKIRIVHESQVLPPIDSSDNLLPTDVIGKKDDTPVYITGAVNSIMAVVKGLLDLCLVRSTDSTSNVQFRDVIGNKLDAAVFGIGTTKSIIAYAKGILGVLLVISPDNAANTQVRGTVGNKADTANTAIDSVSSLMRYIKGLMNRTGGVDLTIVEDTATGTPKVSFPASSATANTFGTPVTHDASTAADYRISSIQITRVGSEATQLTVVTTITIDAADKITFSGVYEYVLNDEGSDGYGYSDRFTLTNPVFVPSGSAIAIKVSDSEAVANTYWATIQYEAGT